MVELRKLDHSNNFKILEKLNLEKHVQQFTLNG